MLRPFYLARFRQAVVLLLLAGCTCAALAWGGDPRKEHKRDYKREIEAIEELWRTTELNHDEPTMAKLLADDYLGISIAGEVMDKTQQLDRMHDRDLVLTKIQLSEKKIKLVGSVAIVTSLAQIEGTNLGSSIDGQVRYTRIYRRYADGTWRITNFEVTKIPKNLAGKS